MAALLVQIIIIAMAFSSGEALKCFVCNSGAEYHGDDCKNIQPYDNKTQSTPAFLTTCDANHLRCRVIVQDVEGESRIVRSCATWPDTTKPNRCIDRTGTSKIKIQYCECEGDGCNSSSALYASALTLLLLFFSTALF